MLVVISDLHFEEEATDNIPGHDNHPPVHFSRNLGPKAYQRFVAHLAQEAIRNGARRLDLALAGDIFDVNRTSLWFDGNNEKLRPYVSADGVSPTLEGLLLNIISAIQSEPEVADSLAVFRLLVHGRYWDGGQELDFPVPAHLHYIPGNHDRMVNATPAARRLVRECLGLHNSAAPFPRVLTFEQEHALIRHGHEYDRYNFSVDHRNTAEIPAHLPDEQYADAPFGDFATIDIASRLPSLFRQVHGDDKIVASHILRTVYLRLLEFDDLRPQRAMMNFLLHMPETGMTPRLVWNVIEPVIYALFEEIQADPYFHHWLRRLDVPWRLDVIDGVQAVLALKLWRRIGIPLPLVQFVSNAVVGGLHGEGGAPLYASREQVILSGDLRFLIAGHTHGPRVELIGSDQLGERYYIDAGTWRNRIPATPDYQAFGRLKALTYAVVYGADEDRGAENRPKAASIDFWSGVTQRWYTLE